MAKLFKIEVVRYFQDWRSMQHAINGHFHHNNTSIFVC